MVSIKSHSYANKNTLQVPAVLYTQFSPTLLYLNRPEVCQRELIKKKIFTVDFDKLHLKLMRHNTVFKFNIINYMKTLSIGKFIQYKGNLQIE